MKSLCFIFLALAYLPAKGEVTTVPHVDLERYLGKWYEVASIPQWFQSQCVGNTTAEYSMAEHGYIRVLNSCDKANGRRSRAEGRAKVVDETTHSKLKVTFVKLVGWIFAFGGNYWILDLAPDYSYALIGDPSRKYAWILSRTPQVTEAFYREAELKFRSQGYDTCEILTSQRTPLCNLNESSHSLNF